MKGNNSIIKKEHYLMLQPAALITSKARNNRSKHLRSKIKSPKPETHTTKGPNWSKNREGSNTEII